jgi:uncharacterized YigZ family protein
MITIQGNTETTIVIKRSKFLGLACRVESEANAQRILEQRKKEHYNATHNCFAFFLENNLARYSDDGEPQGTAGLPMLEVIKKNGLSDVLVICTRYFGGTLLGAGGLVRAYTQSAAETIGTARRVELIPCSVYSCTFSYNVWAKAEKVLTDAGYILDDVQYADEVTVSISVISGGEEAFLKHIAGISLGQTIPQRLGQRRMERII